MVAANCRYHRGNKLCLSKYLGLNEKEDKNKSAQLNELAHEEGQCSTSGADFVELEVSADEGSEMCISSEESIDWSNSQGQRCTTQIQSKDQAMYGVVSFLRTDIAAMTQKIVHYPEPSDLEMEECQKFVPLSLLQAALWLVDQRAFENVLPFGEASPEAKLKAMTLSETIMCMSGNTITPQPLGMAVYLDHVFGSSELVDVVGGLEYCVSYDELRRYKTSAAQHTLRSSQTVAVDNIPTYVPTDLKKPGTGEMGSGLLDEGTDNVDITVETKDGKSTFHALARFVFQDQCVSSMSEKIAIPRKKEKSLKLSDEVLKLVELEPYRLPPIRPVPPRTHDAVKKMNDLKLCNQATNGTKDTTWLLLRMIPRGILPEIGVTMPTDKIVVPLWKGYNHQMSVPQTRHIQTKTHRAHLPIIDAPPSDKRTLYTSMAQCKRMTKSLGQESSVQTMDQQLYALAQEVKWHLSDEFASHILRLGSFHGMMSFLSSMGKIWGDAGLRDLLVDSGVYAAGTVFWETGTTTKFENTHRFVPVHKIVKHRGLHMMSILPHIHALSGCDSTSGLFYVGKKTAMKIISNHGAEKFMALSALAEDDTTAAVDAARTVVSLWYDSAGIHKQLHGDLNRLRTKMASTKYSAMSRLPPSEPVFLQHVLRTMWQVRLWVNARTPELVSGSPFECGWEMTHDGIEPVMYSCTTAAEMIDGLACDCKGKTRCKEKCPCYVAGLPCIELCICESEDLKCHNPKTFFIESVEEN